MNDKYEFYLPVSKGEVTSGGRRYKCTHVRCSLEYDKGTRNFLTGERSSRGYYLSADPVTIDDGIERCALGAGFKALLVECARKSSIKEALAKTLFETHAREIVYGVFGDGVDLSQLPRSPTDELKEVL